MSVHERVGEVFLRPQPLYSPGEAAELLGWTIAETEAAIREGDLEVTPACAGHHVPWQEVAAMITAQHPQAVIEKALGREVTSVMPELVRLAELRVEIPRYQTVMLTKLAVWLNEAIPQFSSAIRWPES